MFQIVMKLQSIYSRGKSIEENNKKYIIFKNISSCTNSTLAMIKTQYALSLRVDIIYYFQENFDWNVENLKKRPKMIDQGN